MQQEFLQIAGSFHQGPWSDPLSFSSSQPGEARSMPSYSATLLPCPGRLSPPVNRIGEFLPYVIIMTMTMIRIIRIRIRTI